MRGRRVIVPPENTRQRVHLFSSQHEPTAYAVLLWLKETGQAVTASEISAMLVTKKDTTNLALVGREDQAELRHVLKVLERTGLVFEDRSHWPPKVSFNQTAFEVLEDRAISRGSIGWLDTETVEKMGDDHPLKNRVFPCPGNLFHVPVLQDHWHVMPAGAKRPE